MIREKPLRHQFKLTQHKQLHAQRISERGITLSSTRINNRFNYSEDKYFGRESLFTILIEKNFGHIFMAKYLKKEIAYLFEKNPEAAFKRKKIRDFRSQKFV